MAKYMINICYGEQKNWRASARPEDREMLMQKYMEWSQRIANKTIFAHKLKDESGRRLDFRNGEIQDGPFAETKESIGGFYIVEAANYNEAVELARGCPSLQVQGSYVEVREVEF